MIKKLDDIFNELKSCDKKAVLSVAAAHDEEVLLAVKDACEMDIIKAILIGEEDKIRKIASEINFNLDNVEVIDESDLKLCAEKAVKLVSSGKADYVMKGLLDTSIILKEVLNKEYGLRTDSLLSHVMIYEVPSYHKLLILTDGGMNIDPDVSQKKKIADNAIKAAKSLGINTVKVACLAAKEKVNPKMQATLDADELKSMCKDGMFGKGVVVEGPIAFDLAVSEEACKIKGYESEVGGDADILLVPTIETGNGIGKALTYMANAKSAGIIMGAKAPVVLVSRADTHESKLYSIAYGAIATK
ncbi:bifunctional enoyl-CoA hydratase/phosphate acetyltransferase [Peptacetobacter hiranonis]|uniref:Putative phosphate butyryltransferase n=1 Tax=Peptacetobacter hiranonis (strain DSM 13275 / JCM 10541 / KCTC 15199 / TO-931) TaxID=500633 RepID=B6G105_PEPHT|nr:bifunctional enoyl-CoA hydratase/phosphate acetyltransferase [Peptacetobacter hiranonis]EEA84580.1 putative phosphate butyryltransferase [Peptacetobacter hiranonis DSM 13275]QEK21598.1 Phosphate acetyltransferase [Peptacetobacter hiranonis]